MVKPGMQLADKMPDAYIQLWAASLLRGKVHGFFTKGFEQMNRQLSAVVWQFCRVNYFRFRLLFQAY